MYKNEHMDIPCADAPKNPQLMGEHPPNLQHNGKIPIWHTDIPETYWCIGKLTNEWGCKLKGRHPHTGEVCWRCPTCKGPLQPPTTWRSLWEHTDAHRSMGNMWVGAYTPGGIQMYGVYKCRGYPDTLKYKNMPASKRSRVKPYLKLNS